MYLALRFPFHANDDLGEEGEASSLRGTKQSYNNGCAKIYKLNIAKALGLLRASQ